MILPSLDFEKKLWQQGKKFVCGVDEVGRGSFAGPVVVGAVIFPVDCELIKGVADSKLLIQSKREFLDKQIKQKAYCWAISEVTIEVINKIGIGKATQQAFLEVIKKLSQIPDHILIDAFYINGIDKDIQTPVVKGDQKVFSISAASIIAKVYRDNLMVELHKENPEYGWDKNKGYGTREHRENIKGYGLSKYHRSSFNLGKYLSS